MKERPHFAVLFAVFLATGLVCFAYLSRTVYRRAGEQLSKNPVTETSHAVIANWMRRGYFASHGLLVPVEGENRVYRWSSGGYFLTAFVAEKLWVAATGRYSWRVVALHNVFVALVTAALLGVLAFRFARAIGIEPLHSLALAVAAQMVQFTFPDNLALYWIIRSQAWWLLFAIAFLLFEERALAAGRTRRLDVAQALIVFAMVYVEFIYATAFLGAYATAVMLLHGERPPLRRLAAMFFLPWLAALLIYQVQVRTAAADPSVQLFGSSFLYRTGLDGDAALYGNHLGIALGRDRFRKYFPGQNQYLWSWPTLFFAGAAALLLTLGVHVRRRLPPGIATALLALTGSYVLYAAVFSQAVAVHPYLYDVLLATPLILALFTVAPALAEEWTAHTGVFVFVVCVAATWTAMFHLRVYALCNPPP